MGQRLVGIISSDLTPEEVIDLPKQLNLEKPLGIPREGWNWEVSDISVDFLKDYWTRSEGWYINELKNKRYDQIYKYPSIETNELLWRILFFEPTLICIGLPLRYYPDTLKDLQSKIETINAAAKLAKFFGQGKMLITFELGSGDTQEEKTGVHFGNLSNMIDSFRRTNRSFRQIEF